MSRNVYDDCKLLVKAVICTVQYTCKCCSTYLCVYRLHAVTAHDQ